MKVTPLDIRRKEFKRSVRGYADEEVDLFLDEVADEFERLHKESAELLERLRRQEEQLTGHQQLREALEKTLVSAQLQADQTRANAQKESEALVRDAEAKARAVVAESYTEVQRVQQALVQLKQLEEDFRSKFQSLLEGHLRLLAEASLTLPREAVAVGSPVTGQGSAASAEGTPQQPGPTPFVVPAGLRDVPEYPPVPVRQDTVDSPQAAQTAVAAGQPVDPGASASPAEPASSAPPATEPVQPEPAVARVAPAGVDPPALLWAAGSEADANEDTSTAEQGGVEAEADPTHSEDETRVMTPEPAAVVGDDSMTPAGEEDPLRSFFFAPSQDDAGESGTGGKNKPRDFEW